MVPNRRHDEVKYCSRDCKTAAGWEVFACAKCSTEFKRKKSDNSKSQVRFCSTLCSLQSRKGRKHRPDPDLVKHYVECESCKKSFQVTKTRKDSARFCSTLCKFGHVGYRKLMSEAQTGDKHWRWNGGRYKNRRGYIQGKSNGPSQFEHRNVVFDAMMKDCPEHQFIIEVDGVKNLSPKVEVHHIDRNRSNNDLSNLLAVTKFAHSQIHHRNKKPEPWECWPSNPERW